MEAESEGKLLEIRCDGCGKWVDQPVVRIDERVYCCESCAAGEGCDCPDLRGVGEGDETLKPLWAGLARG